MNYDRLENDAFEAYFHALVCHQRPLCVHYDKYKYYDYVDGRVVTNLEERGSIDWKVLLPLVECKGQDKEDCLAMMESWAANPSMMDYWIPKTSLWGPIDAVAKWTLPGDQNQVQFCFLQVTTATTHKWNAEVLWQFVKPFVDRQLAVCYMVLLPNEDKMHKFRWSPPAQITTKKEVLDHIPLYVAHISTSRTADADGLQ